MVVSFDLSLDRPVTILHGLIGVAVGGVYQSSNSVSVHDFISVYLSAENDLAVKVFVLKKNLC
jgi:hypothetical protein